MLKDAAISQLCITNAFIILAAILDNFKDQRLFNFINSNKIWSKNGKN